MEPDDGGDDVGVVVVVVIVSFVSFAGSDGGEEEVTVVVVVAVVAESMAVALTEGEFPLPKARRTRSRKVIVNGIPVWKRETEGNFGSTIEMLRKSVGKVDDVEMEKVTVRL